MSDAHAPVAAPLADGSKPRVAIVVALFNEDLTTEMRRLAEARAVELGFDPTPVVTVNGSWDLPIAVDRALQRDDVAAAVALGCIVTGETEHDEVIGFASAKSLLDIALKHGKPVGLGITGPGQTFAQAKARVDRAAHAVDAVARTFAAFAALASDEAPR